MGKRDGGKLLREKLTALPQWREYASRLKTVRWEELGVCAARAEPFAASDDSASVAGAGCHQLESPQSCGGSFGLAEQWPRERRAGRCDNAVSQTPRCSTNTPRSTIFVLQTTCSSLHDCGECSLDERAAPVLISAHTYLVITCEHTLLHARRDLRSYTWQPSRRTRRKPESGRSSVESYASRRHQTSPQPGPTNLSLQIHSPPLTSHERRPPSSASGPLETDGAATGRLSPAFAVPVEGIHPFHEEQKQQHILRQQYLLLQRYRSELQLLEEEAAVRKQQLDEAARKTLKLEAWATRSQPLPWWGVDGSPPRQIPETVSGSPTMPCTPVKRLTAIRTIASPFSCSLLFGEESVSPAFTPFAGSRALASPAVARRLCF